MLDLIFYSPNFQPFASLQAAKKFDRELQGTRGNWGHDLSNIEDPSGQSVENSVSDRWWDGNILKKHLCLFKEPLLITTHFKTTMGWGGIEHPGKRKLVFLSRIEDFAKTRFSKVFSNERDSDSAIEIVSMLQALYIIRKKMRAIDRKWHPLVTSIEEQSNYILHNECFA